MLTTRIGPYKLFPFKGIKERDPRYSKLPRMAPNKELELKSSIWGEPMFPIFSRIRGGKLGKVMTQFFAT